MAAPELHSDFVGGNLRVLARLSRHAGQTRFLLTLAEIYDGGARSDAARLGRVGLQAVRDWVLCFNGRHAERNRLAVMLSHLAGLRVGEIASLRTAIRWKTASGPCTKDSPI